jgi:hypothetical protein
MLPFLLILFAVATASPSGADYQKILFPAGLPAEENPWTGARQKPQFTFYDAASLGESGAVAVTFSTGFVKPGSDGSHEAFLVVLTASGETLHQAAVVNVTEHCPVSVEFPGNVLAMDAKLNSFAIPGDARYVHLNLWCVLSGTGYLSGGSDLFFRLDENSQPKLVLALEASDSFSREGSSAAQAKSSDLYLVDLDGDGRQELMVKTQAGAAGDASQSSSSETVYVFADGGLRPSPDLHRTNKLGAIATRELVKSTKRHSRAGGQ